jgi:hypothetical protein
VSHFVSDFNTCSTASCVLLAMRASFGKKDDDIVAKPQIWIRSSWSDADLLERLLEFGVPGSRCLQKTVYATLELADLDFGTPKVIRHVMMSTRRAPDLRTSKVIRHLMMAMGRAPDLWTPQVITHMMMAMRRSPDERTPKLIRLEVKVMRLRPTRAFGSRCRSWTRERPGRGGFLTEWAHSQATRRMVQLERQCCHN